MAAAGGCTEEEGGKGSVSSSLSFDEVMVWLFITNFLSTVDSVLTHTSLWTRIAMGYYRVWVSSEVSLAGVIKAKSGCSKLFLIMMTNHYCALVQVK